MIKGDITLVWLQGQWAKRGKEFAETVYGIHTPDDVLISYDV